MVACSRLLKIWHNRHALILRRFRGCLRHFGLRPEPLRYAGHTSGQQERTKHIAQPSPALAGSNQRPDWLRRLVGGLMERGELNRNSRMGRTAEHVECLRRRRHRREG